MFDVQGPHRLEMLQKLHQAPKRHVDLSDSVGGRGGGCSTPKCVRNISGVRRGTVVLLHGIRVMGMGMGWNLSG